MRTRAYRSGDANMRSVWLCSRNDLFGTIAVLLAALGVLGTGTGWPDIVVAAIMAGIALQGSFVVIRQSSRELRSTAIGLPDPASDLNKRQRRRCSRNRA